MRLGVMEMVGGGTVKKEHKLNYICEIPPILHMYFALKVLYWL